MNGPSFLHHNDPQLHASPAVEQSVAYLRASGTKIDDKPADRIEAYLAFLADPNYANDGYLTGDAESITRQVAAQAISAEAVPDSHFEREARIGQENGHDVVEYSDQQKYEIATRITHDQKASLSRWVDYLNGPFSNHEDWFKVYVLNGVIKLGDFNREEQSFGRRTKTSTGMFADLSPEAVGLVHTAITNQKLSANVQTNFGKLYAHALRDQQPAHEAQLQVTVGAWKLYEWIGDDEDEGGPVHSSLYRHPDVRELTRSLQGRATGWCIAGEADAANCLNEGDMYIYYSQDAEGKNTIPRAAIRTGEYSVLEVRGIHPNQQVEPIMLDIVRDKLQELDGGSEYFKNVADMQRVTEIYAAVTADPTYVLSRDDLHLIYEIDGPVTGFRLDERTDPRVIEIKQLRQGQLAQDMRVLFDLREDMSLTEQLLTESWVDLVDNGWSDDETERENRTEPQKQALLYWHNFEALARADTPEGQRYLFDYLCKTPQRFNEYAQKLSLLAELGAIIHDEAREQLFKDKADVIRALTEGIFTADKFPLTAELLTAVFTNTDTDKSQLKELFSERALKGVMAGSNDLETIRIYLMAGLPNRDFSRALKGMIVETDYGLPLPSNAVMKLLNPNAKRQYLRKWAGGGEYRRKKQSEVVVGLLSIDSLLEAEPLDDDGMYSHNLPFSSRGDFYEVVDHNQLAQVLAGKRPDVLGAILEDLKNLNVTTYSAIVNAGLASQALDNLKSFAGSVDSNQIIVQALRTNSWSINSINRVLEVGQELRPEIVDILIDGGVGEPRTLIKSYNAFTEAAQARIIEYMYYQLPMALLSAPAEREARPYRRGDEFYSRSLSSYVPKTFVDAIDHNRLFAAMTSVPANSRLAILNRDLFPEGVFKDEVVIDALEQRKDYRTLYWALEKNLLHVAEDKKQQLMAAMTDESAVESYRSRDTSLDVDHLR
ncbi:MAG TPA: hypothetical protein VH234_03900 [Candidatus Saccharimonadales bacterium]|jgi:hypothetical protein|nr:hypothetical protein [Candidatus Saccharimonadales bacterium]